MTDAVEMHSRIAAEFDGKYASSPNFRERRVVWERLIGEWGGDNSDVLDAGCGSGVLSIIAARSARRVLAFDGSAEMVELAQRNAHSAGAANIELKVGRFGDGRLLPAERRFDLVLCSSVLEYLDDYWRAFDWLTSHLRPGGRIIFSMPNGTSLHRAVEAAVFRATGRPAYFACVRNVPRPAVVIEGVQKRELVVEQIVYYGAAPVLSRLARPAGLSAFSDTLFALVCRAPAQERR